LGCNVVGPDAERERSGIVTFDLPDVPTTSLADALRRRQIVFSERDDMVRLSPHFYNTHEEIDLVLEAVASLVRLPQRAMRKAGLEERHG
jgi:selenocysteine lyase/cysteine desulfurase